MHNTPPPKYVERGIYEYVDRANNLIIAKLQIYRFLILACTDIFALQQQQVLTPTLKIWAAGRSQKAEFATVQRPKTARNACKSKSIQVLHAATGTNLNLKSKTQSQQAIDRAFWQKKIINQSIK